MRLQNDLILEKFMNNKEQPDFLFGISGKHVASWVDEQLYAPSGKNIGHYLSDLEIFIDMNGNYLGEIIFDDRLVHDMNSPYKSQNFGILGDFGNINLGNPGSYAPLSLASNYTEINHY